MSLLRRSSPARSTQPSLLVRYLYFTLLRRWRRPGLAKFGADLEEKTVEGWADKQASVSGGAFNEGCEHGQGVQRRCGGGEKSEEEREA